MYGELLIYFNLELFIKKLKSAFIIPFIPLNYKNEYHLERFRNNNLRIFILSAVLFIEQLLLGFLLAEPGSFMRNVHFVTSGGIFVFSIISYILLNRRLEQVRLVYEIFEILFVVYGMSIALIRMLVVQETLTGLPTVYVAILYGAAVIFIFRVWQSILIYIGITIAAAVLFPVFHPEVASAKFVSDIVTNGIIAMVIIILNAKRFIISFLDKKKIEIINQELREQTIRDGLTGLYNRRKLDEVLNEVCLKASRYSNDFSVIMIDLDHFKSINDNYGHHVGDSVLMEFSKTLENNIRDVDVCGRWGGEEFLVICQETELGAARFFAERLRKSIETRDFSSGLKITASFGVSSWSGCTDEETLLKEVDDRLYKAKAGGRNMVCAGIDC